MNSRELNGPKFNNDRLQIKEFFKALGQKSYADDQTVSYTNK